MFEARRPSGKGVAVNGTTFFEKLHRAIDSRKRYTAVNLDRTAKNLQRIGMVFRLGQYVQDDPARPRDANACLTQLLFIIGLLVRFSHAPIMHRPTASCKFLQLDPSRSPQPIIVNAL